MKSKYFSLFDKITGSYIQLVNSPSVEVLKRDLVSMKMMLSGADVPLFILHPSDYDLYYIGEFNQLTGEFIPDLEFILHLTDVIGDGDE